MIPSSSRHIAFVCLIFVVSVGYFVVSGSWYAPAVLEIEGSLSKIPAGFDVMWDSGSGFNRYETYRVQLNTTANSVKETQDVTISYLGKKRNASLSKRVFLDGVQADGEKVAGSHITLSDTKPNVVFDIAADHHISISLLTNNYSGFVGINVNGVTLERDLYVANVEAKSKSYDYWLVNKNNEFLVRAVLPRYHIKDLKLVKRKDGKSIKLDSITLHTNGKSVALMDNSQYLTTLGVGSTSEYQKRYFEWGRFIQQLIFAWLITWIFSGLLRIYWRCGGLRKIIQGEERVFVFLFCGAFLCYLSWLLIFWPGVMSVDSLKLWRAAQLPDIFLNDHPLLNVFLYSFLFHLWNNPAIVPLFHITASSALIGYFFYYLYKQNVPLKFTLPFYFLIIISVPIGIYNTVLWKDIPFAILVVFWACMSAILYHKKQQGTLPLGWEKKSALFLLFMSLCLIRHNGVVYLLVIPILFQLLGIIKLSRYFWLSGIALIIIAAGSLLLVDITGVSDSSYLFDQTRSYLNKVLRGSYVDVLARSWFNYWKMLDINNPIGKWDLWHFYLGDRYAYGFLQHAQWNDVYAYIGSAAESSSGLREMAMKTYWLSYKEPFVFVAWYPVWALILFLISIAAFRWLPLSAIFSIIILSPVFALNFLNILNWRYYYFVCFAAYFIVPMIIWDINRVKNNKVSNEV